MINKVIHYCWFGKNKLPEEAIKCIESWRHYCPDYEIVEWNEDNYDVNKNKYMSDAYKEKKWAFVSDYARIKILLEHGGIYCDTDVEIIRNLDDLLNQEAFIGFELGLDGEYGVNTGSMMGAQAGNQYLRLQEVAYRTYTFGEVTVSGRTKTCVDYTTELMLQYGLVRNNQEQTVLGVTVYPSDYFSPRNMDTGRIDLTNNSRSIHRYDGTWASQTEQRGYHMKWECIEKYGEKAGRIIYVCKYSCYIIRHDGFSSFFKKIGQKIAKK